MSTFNPEEMGMPDPPYTVGQTFTYGKSTWAWDGERWGKLIASNFGNTSQILVSAGLGEPPVWSDKITLSAYTALTNTSGVSFANIPSYVQRITVLTKEASLSGTDRALIRLGTATGFANTGYICSVKYLSSTTLTTVTETTGVIASVAVAANKTTSRLTIDKLTGNTWVIGGHYYADDANNGVAVIHGIVTLDSELNSIAVVPAGTNTFDSGNTIIKCE